MATYTENPISEQTGLTVEFMKENDYLYWKEVNGILYAVTPMSFGKGRIVVDCHKFGYEDFYCFSSVELAVSELEKFEGKDGEEFNGWHRHFGTSRRRDDGDSTKEYIMR